MKRLILPIILVLLFTGIVLVSCDKEEEVTETLTFETVENTTTTTKKATTTTTAGGRVTTTTTAVTTTAKPTTTKKVLITNPATTTTAKPTTTKPIPTTTKSVGGDDSLPAVTAVPKPGDDPIVENTPVGDNDTAFLPF